MRTTTTIRLSGFQLLYGAKRTDWISGVNLSNTSFLISERMYEILSKFRLAEHSMAPATLTHRAKSYLYYYGHLPSDMNQAVDYSRTVFHVGNYGGPYERFIFGTHEHFLEEKNKMQSLNRLSGSMQVARLVELHLAEHGIQVDFFRLTMVSTGLVVSDRLKQAIETAGLTGMDFIPAEGFNPKSI